MTQAVQKFPVTKEAAVLTAQKYKLTDLRTQKEVNDVVINALETQTLESLNDVRVGDSGVIGAAEGHTLTYVDGKWLGVKLEIPEVDFTEVEKEFGEINKTLDTQSKSIEDLEYRVTPLEQGAIKHLCVIDGVLWTDLPFVSEQSVSAKGLGTGGGGSSTGVDILNNWDNYNEVTKKFALSSELGWGLKQDISANARAIDKANEDVSKLTVNYETLFANDTLLQEKIDNLSGVSQLLEWFKKDDDGNVYTPFNFYSTKSLSAKGMGSDSSGADGVIALYKLYDVQANSANNNVEGAEEGNVLTYHNGLWKGSKFEIPQVDLTDVNKNIAALEEADEYLFAETSKIAGILTNIAELFGDVSANSGKIDVNELNILKLLPILNWFTLKDGTLTTEHNLVSNKSVSAKGTGTDGGVVGVSALHQLNDVKAYGDKVQGATKGSVLTYDGTHWVGTTITIPDIDFTEVEEKIGVLLAAVNGNAKTISDLSTDFYTFLTGTDTDETINKWKELEEFLKGFDGTNDLANLLLVKVDKEEYDKTVGDINKEVEYQGKEILKNTIAISEIKDWFTLDKDGETLTTKYNLVSSMAVSAKGASTSDGGSSEGGANTLYELWDVLKDSSADKVAGAEDGSVLVYKNGKWQGAQIDIPEVNFEEIENALDALDATVNAHTTQINGLQNTVTEQGREIAKRYLKPSTGIPLSDLASGIQTSLGLANTAFQAAAFTKTNIKTTLGISDWALNTVKPSYKTSEITEENNLYFTNERAVTALKPTTDALNTRITLIEDWFTLKDGTLVTKYNLVSEKAVSAKGVGSEGEGNNVSYDRLDTWDSYTSDKAGYVLSAALGWDLKTMIENLDLGDFDLSEYYKAAEVDRLLGGKQDAIADLAVIRSNAATAFGWGDHSTKGYLVQSSLNGYVNEIATTGNGNAITAVTKDGKKITFNKGVTFLTDHQNIFGLTIKGSDGTTILSYTPNAGAKELTLSKSHVGLSNVENTRLSTWAGTNKITTLGTITTGTWNGSKIANNYLVNPFVTIAGTKVALGGGISVEDLQQSLDIVTTKGDQDITGIKTFKNGIKIGNAVLWVNEDGVLMTDVPFASLASVSAKGIGTNGGTGGGGGGSTIDLTNVVSNILPSTSAYSIGSSNRPWGSMYANSIYMNGNLVATDADLNTLEDALLGVQDTLNTANSNIQALQNSLKDYQPLATAINTGNIANQSVSYATNAGNANTLGNLSYTGYMHSERNANLQNTAGNLIINVTGSPTWNDDVYKYGVVLQWCSNYALAPDKENTGNYYAQLYSSAKGDELYYRRKYSNSDWRAFKQIAFTDSDITGNAATATKLKVPVSIWGNSFDGSQGVSGVIRTVSQIYSSIEEGGTYNRWTIEKAEGSDLLYITSSSAGGTGKSGRIALAGYGAVDLNRVMIRSSRTNISGNLYIGGYTEDSGYKLYVNGNSYVNGTLNASGDATFDTTVLCKGILSVGTADNAKILLNRTGYNYIWADAAGGTLVFGVKDVGVTSPEQASLLVKANGVTPGARNNAVSLGSTSSRWSNVYSVNGDYSGNLTVTGSTTTGDLYINGVRLWVEDGVLYTDASFASKKAVSAKGLGTSSEGAGVDYDRLDSWDNYDSTKAGYVLSAKLGYELKDAIDNMDIPSLSGVATESWVEGKLDGLAKVAKTGLYSDLSGVPTKVSQFTNDKSYQTLTEVNALISTFKTTIADKTYYLTSNFTKDKIKSTLGISDWALAETVPTTDAVAEGKTNLYFTTTRVKDYLTGAISTVLTNALTANRVVVSNTNGKITASGITTTKLGYLTDVTSNIQAQFTNTNTAITGVSNRLTKVEGWFNDDVEGELSTTRNIKTTGSIAIGDATLSWDGTTLIVDKPFASTQSVSAKGIGTNGGGSGSAVDLTNVVSDIIPASSTYKIGSSAKPFGSVYANSIYMNGNLVVTQGDLTTYDNALLDLQNNLDNLQTSIPSTYATIKSLEGYLPLSGGTIKSSIEQALTLHRTADYGGTGIKFIGEGKSAWVGFEPRADGHGAYIYTNGHYLWLASDGVAKLDSNTLIHSGNIGSQSVESANRLRFIMYVPLSGFDANTSLVGGGYIPNYADVSRWGSTMPRGMRYGVIYQLQGSSTGEDLAGQLAWDVHHHGADSTNRLWWRANDDTEFANAKWHQIAFTDSNVASANYATSAGNADTLDDYDSTAFMRFNRETAGVDLNELSTMHPRVVEVLDATNTPTTSTWHQVMTWGSADSGYGVQIAHQYTNAATPLYFRNKISGNWGDWKEIALTTSNVASATKLATARTIWGQSFDGSGNVTGALSGVTTITGVNSSSLLIHSSGSQNIGLAIDGNSTRGVTLNATHFKPYDLANGLLDLGSTSARWKGIYGQTLNLTGHVYLPNEGRICEILSDGSKYVDLMYLNINNYLLIGQGVAKSGYSTNIYGNTISLAYGTAGTTSNTALFVSSDGNVGIGTTSPSYKLDVDGESRFSGDGHFQNNLEVLGSTKTKDLYIDGVKLWVQDGVLYTDASFASLKSVSAKGTGTSGGTGGGVDVDWNNFPSSIIPSNNTYDLGSNAKPWDRLFATYVGGASNYLYFDGSGILVQGILSFASGMDYIDTDGTGYFYNLYVDGVEVATKNDIPSLMNYYDKAGVHTYVSQEINTFSEENLGMAAKKGVSTSVSSGDANLVTGGAVASALNGYLPSSGGAIIGTSGSLLTLDRTDGNPYIQFNHNGGYVGRYGFNKDTYAPIVNLVDGTVQTVLHTSNYSKYALPLTGGEIKGSLGVTVNITAQGGTFVNGLKVGGNNVIHSGNIGDYAFIARDLIINDTDANTMTLNGAYLNATGNGSGNSNFPQAYSVIATFRQSNAYIAQLSIGYPDIYVRRKIDIWTNWVKLITNENIGSQSVASATKLATPRTIWGQSFDGSGDVSGSLIMPRNKAIKVTDTNSKQLEALQLNNSNDLLLGQFTAKEGYDTVIYGNTLKLAYGNYGLSSYSALVVNSSGNVTIGSSDLASTDSKLYVNGNSYVNGILNVSNVIEANKGINIYGALTGYVSGTDSDTWSITDQGAASFARVKFGGGPSICKHNNETSLVIATKGVSTIDCDKATTLHVISKGAVGVEWSTAIHSLAYSEYNVVGSGVGLSLGGHYARGNSDAPVGRGAGIAAVAEASWYNSTGLAFYVNHSPSSTSDDFTEKMRLSCNGHLIPMHTTSQTLGTSNKRWHNVYSSSLNVSGAASVGSLTINGATAATQTWVQNQGYATTTSVNNSLGSLSAEISAVDARIDALGTAAKKNWSGASSADTTNLVTIGWVESKLAGYATAASIPTKTSQLTNDSNFLSGHIETTVIGGGVGLVTGGAVFSFVEGSLSGYAKKATTLSGYGITDALPKSNPSVTGTLTVAGNVLPSANDTHALGSTNYRWSKLYANGVDCTGSISSTTNISAQGNVTAINGGLSGKTLSVSGAASVGSLTVGGAVHSNLNIGGYRIKTEGGDIYGVYDGLDKLMYFDASAAFCSAFVQTSDERLKNILNGDFRLSLGTMANAPLVQFDWKNKPNSKHHIGTIAQYWDSCLPEVVSRTKNNTLALSYGELGVAMGISLAKEMIEMLTRVDNTESEIDKLKKRISELEKEIENLKA